MSILTSTDTIREARTATVSLKSSWSDDWEEVEFLWVDWVVWSASPTIPSAGLSWRYGIGMRQGETSFDTVEKQDVLQHYIKIEVEQGDGEDPLCWYGRIEEDARNPEGAMFEDGQRIATGPQTLVAYGLEILLERTRMITCQCASSAAMEKKLGHAIDFNAPNQSADNGNRTTVHGADGTYIFEGLDLKFADPWSSKDIVEYLLFYHAPRDANNTRKIPFQLDADAEKFLQSDDRPFVRTHGRTIKELLDEVMDRRRLVSYVLEVEDDTVKLRPFTFAEHMITLPDNRIIRANDSQQSYDFDTAVDIESATVRRSAAVLYNQVVVQGARIICCGTIAKIDNSLDKQWAAAAENEYRTAATGAGDYASLERAEQQKRNRDYRKQDHLQRVYAYYGLPPGDDWDGKVGDGEGAETNPLFPFEELDLDPQDHGAWVPASLVFERQLPLKTDHDYSENKIANDAVVDATPSEQHWEYRRPMVLIELKDQLNYDDTSRFAPVERLATCSGIEATGDGEGRTWCASVRMQEDNPGFVLRVSGAPQHAIDSGMFVPIDSTDEVHGNFVWHALVATIAMKAWQHVEGRWPSEKKLVQEAGDEDTIRRLWIDAGDKYQLHYVAPGTVVDLDDGELVKTTDGGFVHDDRDTLEALARVAYEWYGVERQTLQLTYLQAIGVAEIGDLVTTIGADETEEPIRTVVTEIRLDMGRSAEESHRTTISTQWAEMDVLQL